MGQLQSFLSKATLTITLIIGAALSQNLLSGKTAAWAAIILAALQSLEPAVHKSADEIDTANAAIAINKPI